MLILIHLGFRGKQKAGLVTRALEGLNDTRIHLASIKSKIALKGPPMLKIISLSNTKANLNKEE